ncbi:MULTISPECIES: hypothetical protein [Rhodopseudomonas]|uniref:Uncharacterized protein n=1 Tax=Rhodopseudomonas palustris TaxID=1076 RepID=A0A0D7EI19_RHOPL|nr:MULTISPECIES: hypothetical protein [Rhodopseudomonas]KIZ40160.1 hypothetical protein OO17_18470 [Rhodopseudomonas palustris]MDF3810522.1 hypothetical protein [Rhodopseudomonas sp. BAL398]WOK20221.1 hypothetical protein RBJ75_12185 [Rhodopseudomonas sp. BAL398]
MTARLGAAGKAARAGVIEDRFLDLDQVAQGGVATIRPMAHILFRCPRTNMNVQTWLADEPPSGQSKAFEALDCPACTQLHFINRTTGKLLGEKK